MTLGNTNLMVVAVFLKIKNKKLANFRNPTTKKKGMANPTKRFKKTNSPYLDTKKLRSRQI
jgi:hypothetical protein